MDRSAHTLDALKTQCESLRFPTHQPLLNEYMALWMDCRAFRENRTHHRALRLSLGLLANLGRHTLTGTICATGRQFMDWTSEYRLFSPVPMVSR